MKVYNSCRRNILVHCANYFRLKTDLERKDMELAETIRRLENNHALELQSYSEQIQELELSKNMLRQQVEQLKDEILEAKRDAVQELQQTFDTYKRQTDSEKAILEEDIMRLDQEIEMVNQISLEQYIQFILYRHFFIIGGIEFFPLQSRLNFILLIYNCMFVL